MKLDTVARFFGFPQFISLSPLQKGAVLGLSILSAATIIGLPFAPFIYRGAVAAFNRYNIRHKTPDDHPKEEGIRKKVLDKKGNVGEEPSFEESRQVLQENGFRIIEKGYLPPMGRDEDVQKLAWYDKGTNTFLIYKRERGGGAFKMGLYASQIDPETLEDFSNVDVEEYVKREVEDDLSEAGFWVSSWNLPPPEKKEGEALYYANDHADEGFELVYISEDGEKSSVSYDPAVDNLDEKIRELTTSDDKSITSEEYVEIPVSPEMRHEILKRKIAELGFEIIPDSAGIPPMREGQQVQRIAIDFGRNIEFYQRRRGENEFRRPLNLDFNFKEELAAFENGAKEEQVPQSRDNALRDLGFVIIQGVAGYPAQRRNVPLQAEVLDRGNFLLIYRDNQKIEQLILQRDDDLEEAVKKLKGEVA